MIALIYVKLNEVAKYLSWPFWALESVMILSCIIVVVSFIQNFIFYEKKSAKGEHIDIPIAFRWFQLQYFGPFLIIMLADWLQGTNMYTLYSVSNIQPNFRLDFHLLYILDMFLF